MSYVDAHIHLADPAYAGSVHSILAEAIDKDFEGLISNSIDYASSLANIELAKQFKNTVVAAVGVHPSIVKKGVDLKLERFEWLLSDPSTPAVCVGEIGLDGQYPSSDDERRIQRSVYSFFLTLAEKRESPVTIHSRGAEEEVLSSLSSYRLGRVLLHWYSGPVEGLKSIADKGYFISVGPALFYSQRLIDIATHAELGMILTETDGPVRYRGPFTRKPTRPYFIIDVVRRISELKNLNEAIVRGTVLENFHRYIKSAA